MFITYHCDVSRGTRWRSWFRHCATNRKVAGSIPGVFTGICHWNNPCGRKMADCHEIWDPQPSRTTRACTGIELILTVFICWIRQLWNNEAGREGGLFPSCKNAYKPKMEKWRQQSGRFHTKGAEYRSGVLLRFFTIFFMKLFQANVSEGA
jgi:hypothetical protein